MLTRSYQALICLQRTVLLASHANVLLFFAIKHNGFAKRINFCGGGVALSIPEQTFPVSVATVAVTTGSDGKTSSVLMHCLNFSARPLTQQALQK